MKLPVIARPALASLLALMGAGCGFVEDDPNRFEALAQKVANIRVSVDDPVAEVRGLRPGRHAQRAEAPHLRLEVMDAHAFLEARDGPLNGMIEKAAPAIVQAAAPVVAEAVVREVTTAALRPAEPSAADRVRRMIQIGAYSSEQAARSAWDRLSSATAFSGLAPRYETASVNGRTLTRLKVAVPAAAAAGVCRAAGVTDPWCASTGRG